ncbi:MAG: hypothetical protein PVG66_02460 [Chromatiales bacterium]|jgi:hypothetical protein
MQTIIIRSYPRIIILGLLLGGLTLLASLIQGEDISIHSKTFHFILWAVPFALLLSVLLEPRRIILTEKEIIIEYIFHHKIQPLSELVSYEYPKRWGRYDFVAYKPGTHYKGKLRPVNLCSRGMYKTDDKIRLAQQFENFGVPAFSGNKNNFF